MPKKYGVKEKDQVVAHVVNLVLTGKLRTGDRFDRNEIAEELGLSRVPIQEAVVQLEHDGVLSTRYHRGAFVERFDEDVVLEHHELYGVLNGIAAARARRPPHPEAAGRARPTTATSCAPAPRPATFHENAMRYRQTINDEYAGPRLHAAIRAAQIFMPRAFWTTYLGSHDEIVAVLRSRDRRDPRRATPARPAPPASTGPRRLAGSWSSELVRRRVLGPDSATDGSATRF